MIWEALAFHKLKMVNYFGNVCLKSPSTIADINLWTGRDLSFAYRWIQHSRSFKVYLAGADSLAYMEYDCKKSYQRNSGVEAYGD
jgi:hypothetical protein